MPPLAADVAPGSCSSRLPWLETQPRTRRPRIPNLRASHITPSQLPGELRTG